MALTYPCPSCGAPMAYDPESGEMLCGHCGGRRRVEEAAASGQGEPGDWKVYHCSSCGAEVIGDEQTSATVCSFCGTPNLVEGRLEGEWKPSQVIPFRIGKKKAQELFRAWTKKGLFTPGVFRKQSALEQVTGIYVPFWLYDLDVQVRLQAHATRVRSIRSGDWMVTYTDHYEILRDMNLEYDQVPADASARMPDETMDCLEPFRYEEMRTFLMPYLAGFCSERYDQDSSALEERAEGKVRDSAVREVRSTIGGYSLVNVTRTDTSFQVKRDDYVLLPVWMLTYRYRGKACTLSMNGQTGKIVGNLPLSRGRLAAWFGGLTAGFALVLTAVVYLGGFGL